MMVTRQFSLYLFCIGFLFSSQVNAQLHLCNPSFEGPVNYSDVSPPMQCWTPCQTNHPQSNNISTPDTDDSLAYNPTNGKTFIALVAYPQDSNNESTSGQLACSMLKTGVRYHFSFDAIGYQGGGGQELPAIAKVWWSGSSCDTDQLVFADYINNDTPNLAQQVYTAQWKKVNVSFTANGDYSHIKFKNVYVGPNNPIIGVNYYYSGLFLDNISTIYPDTIYNSVHTPMVLSSDAVAVGSAVTLTSPYTEANQYWYANGSYIGMGKQIQHHPQATTNYTLTLGKDSCIRSVLVTKVKVSTTGINDPSRLAMSIAPNPTTDYLHITSNEPISAYQVFAMDGRMVAEGTMKDNSINVQNLQPSVYCIRLITSKGNCNQWFVKE